MEASVIDLDPAIWSGLPYECLRFVLERVPTDSLMRWHRVSKTWIQHFLSTTTNTSLWLPRVGEPIPMYHIPMDTFTHVVQEETAMTFEVNSFNKRQNSWQDVRFSLHESHPRMKMFRSSTLFTTGGIVLLGLSFMNLNDTAETSLTVFNPTTGAARLLPPPPDTRALSIGLIKSSDARSYAVVAARSVLDEEGSRFFIYKSESNDWHDCGTTSEVISPIPTDAAVSIGNLLLFLLERPFRYNQRSWRMFAFDLNTRTCQDWGMVPTHYGAGKPALLEIAGVILYVCRAKRQLRGEWVHTWKFYELDPKKRQWKRKRSMPAAVYKELNEKIPQNDVRVSGAGNFTYFYGPGLASEGPYCVLAHVHSAYTWLWLPEIVSTVGRSPDLLKDSIMIGLEPSMMPV